MSNHTDYLKFREPWLAEQGDTGLERSTQTPPPSQTSDPMAPFEQSYSEYSPVAEAEQILSEAAMLGHVALLGSIESSFDVPQASEAGFGDVSSETSDS